MASYKVKRKHLREAIFGGVMGLFMVGALVYFLATEEFHWIFVAGLGLFGSMTALAFYGAHQMGRTSVILDDRAIEFREGHRRRRYLWNELQAVRLSGLSSDLTLQLRSGVKHESISSFAEKSKLIEEIIEQAEPRGLFDLPRDGTRFGFVCRRREIILAAVIIFVLGLGALAASYPLQSEDNWIWFVIAALMITGAFVLRRTLQDTYRLQGNLLTVSAFGRKGQIHLDRPYTYYLESGLIELKQEQVRAKLSPLLDGAYNLVRLIQQEGQAGRLAAPKPNIVKYKTQNVIRIVMLAVCLAFFLGLGGAGLVARQRVLEPIRFADQDPVKVEGLVIGSGGDLITYEYEAAGLKYQQKDFVASPPRVGETVQVSYWRVNPHMSYTSGSMREQRGRGMLFNSMVILVLSAVMALLILGKPGKAKKTEPELLPRE